ncbi:hypothetical protein HID58_041913, partial [Brassica napus]
MRLESMSPLQLLSRWKLIQDGIMSCVLFAKRWFTNPRWYKGPVMFDCLLCNWNVIEVLAKFLIFDNIAYPFLHKTADELAEEVAEDGDSVLPNTLNDLIGKILLFNMDATSKNLKSTTFIVQQWFKPNQYD